jgi:hypothetical protein
MVFKLIVAASRTWRRLKGTNQLPKVIAGVRFNDGIEVIQMPANHAARSPRHPKSRIALCLTSPSVVVTTGASVLT